jgi:hypothetical protein
MKAPTLRQMLGMTVLGLLWFTLGYQTKRWIGETGHIPPGLLVSTPPQHSATTLREQRDREFIGTMDPASRAMLENPVTQEARRQNLAAQQSRYVQTADVTALVVMKTQDTGHWVVTIVAPDGKETSFWTMGDAEGLRVPVRTITAY